MTTYNVYQRETLDQTPVQIATGLTSKNHAISGLTKGKKYLFSVGAVRSGLEKISDEKLMLFGQEWTPAELSTALYFDASNIVSSGNIVIQMTDLSGNAFNATQSNNSLRPTLTAFQNGAAAVKFNGSSQYLNIAGSANSLIAGKTSWWQFNVSNVLTSNSLDADILSYSNKVKLYFRAGQKVLSAGGRRRNSDSFSYINGTSELSGLDSISFAQGDFSNQKLELFVNAVKENESTSWLTEGVAELSSIDIRIGAHSATTPTHFANLKLGCTIFGIGILSEIDRQKLEGWAAHKYGLTDNLPADHPYKTLIPTV